METAEKVKDTQHSWLRHASTHLHLPPHLHLPLHLHPPLYVTSARPEEGNGNGGGGRHLGKKVRVNASKRSGYAYIAPSWVVGGDVGGDVATYGLLGAEANLLAGCLADVSALL